MVCSPSPNERKCGVDDHHSLAGTMLVLQAEIAQNGGVATSDQQAQLDDLTTKLAANVKVDQTNAGLTSTSADFTC